MSQFFSFVRNLFENPQKKPFCGEREKGGIGIKDSLRERRG